MSKLVQKIFYFKRPTSEVVSLVQQKFPINLSNFEEIIDEIHDRYPYLEKHKIVYEVHNFFEAYREGLLNRKVFSFSAIANNTHLNFVKKKNVCCVLLLKTRRKFRRKC